jgi:pentatricopeptide repeat protein
MKFNPRVETSRCGALLGTRRMVAAPASLQDRPWARASLLRSGDPLLPLGSSRQSKHPSLQQAFRIQCCPATGLPVPSLLNCMRRLVLSTEAAFSSNGRRHNHAAASLLSPDDGRHHVHRRENEALLRYVDRAVEQGPVDEHLEMINDPFLRRYAPADGPHLRISNRQTEPGDPTWAYLQHASEDVKATLKRLRLAVNLQLKEPSEKEADRLSSLYQSLPEPRMSHIPNKLRHQLMKAIGLVKRDSRTMLRYFSLVSDIKAAGLALSTGEWNKAISFAARYVGRSRHAEAEAALSLWHEMEKMEGIKANQVTFNILFDVASKAGIVPLCEMLYREMENRGFAYNRYHRVSLIHYLGLRGDADGVRAAYKDMVLAGEEINTVVLNSVIGGLLQCGEEDAANHIYDRMKDDLPEAPEMPPRSYNSQLAVTKALAKFAKQRKKTPQDGLQGAVIQTSGKRTSIDVQEDVPHRADDETNLSLGRTTHVTPEVTGRGIMNVSERSSNKLEEDSSHGSDVSNGTSEYEVGPIMTAEDGAVHFEGDEFAAYQEATFFAYSDAGLAEPQELGTEVHANAAESHSGEVSFGETRTLPRTPDLTTYRLLVRHYAIKLGDLATVTRYLDEMQYFNIPLHGSIFLALFRGFYEHGGHPTTNWSEQRLQSILSALLSALDANVAGLTLEKWLALWALKAFTKCSTPETIFKVYQELGQRWHFDEATSNFMVEALHSCLKEKAKPVSFLKKVGHWNP